MMLRVQEFSRKLERALNTRMKGIFAIGDCTQDCVSPPPVCPPPVSCLCHCVQDPASPPSQTSFTAMAEPAAPIPDPAPAQPEADQGDQETVVSWDTKGSARDSLRLDAKVSTGRD